MKTLNDCKLEIVKKLGYMDWDHLILSLDDDDELIWFYHETVEILFEEQKMTMYEKFRNWLHKYGKHYWHYKYKEDFCWDVDDKRSFWGTRRTCKICGKKQRAEAYGSIDKGIFYWMDI